MSEAKTKLVLTERGEKAKKAAQVGVGALAISSALVGVGVGVNAGFDATKAAAAKVFENVEEPDSMYNPDYFSDNKITITVQDGDGSQRLATHIDGFEQLDQAELGKYIEQTNPEASEDGWQPGEQVELPESVKR